MFCEEKCYNILISRRLIFTEEEQDQYQEENKRKIVIEIIETHLYPSCFTPVLNRVSSFIERLLTFLSAP